MDSFPLIENINLRKGKFMYVNYILQKFDED